ECGHAEVAGRFVARTDAANGGGHDLGHVTKTVVTDFPGQRPAELFGLVRVLKDLGLLQEYRRAQARGEDEMTFQHGAAFAEYCQHFVLSHHANSCRYCRPIRVSKSCSLRGYRP